VARTRNHQRKSIRSACSVSFRTRNTVAMLTACELACGGSGMRKERMLSSIIAGPTGNTTVSPSLQCRDRRKADRAYKGCHPNPEPCRCFYQSCQRLIPNSSSDHATHCICVGLRTSPHRSEGTRRYRPCDRHGGGPSWGAGRNRRCTVCFL
jgi:hypothetical protein